MKVNHYINTKKRDEKKRERKQKEKETGGGFVYLLIPDDNMIALIFKISHRIERLLRPRNSGSNQGARNAVQEEILGAGADWLWDIVEIQGVNPVAELAGDTSDSIV